jgi:hypothetical protein
MTELSINLDYFKYKYASDYYAVGKGKIEHTQIKVLEEDDEYKASLVRDLKKRHKDKDIKRRKRISGWRRFE